MVRTGEQEGIVSDTASWMNCSTLLDHIVSVFTEMYQGGSEAVILGHEIERRWAGTKFLSVCEV